MSERFPLISVIVPVYKVEAYLSRCVDSILAQTYPRFELILVDDGSPDGCSLICDRYKALDARVWVIHKENGGLSDARNAGLAVSQGAYIAFVDSDDWVSSDYLEKLLKTIQKTQADICECDIIRTSQYPCSASAEDSGHEVFTVTDALNQLIHDGTFHQYVWNKLYRRSVLEGIFFPKGKLNEDEFWTYLVFARASWVVRLHRPLYFYFQRPDSIMGQQYHLRRLDALEAKCLRQRYLDTNFPELSTTARINLHQSAIFCGQMVLLHLDRDQRKQAKTIIRRCLQEYPLTSTDFAILPLKSKVWLLAGKQSFWTTCRIRNLLKRGF